MNLLTTVLLLSAAVAQLGHAVPAPGKTDAAKIQKNMAKTKGKAKKTQEVLQFGNQQNRQADTRNYARAEKRQDPESRHDPEPVPEVNNAQENYPQSARHEKIADLFYNPDSYGHQTLDIDDRFKRNAYHFGSPVKRSYWAYRPYVDNGRAKRDLNIEPDDLLAMFSLWEAERRQKAHDQSRGSRQHYGHMNEFDPEPYLENEMTDEEDNEEIPGWLEGPVVPAPAYTTPNKYYGNNGFLRKQRQAQHGPKNDYFQGLSHLQEEPQYFRMPDYYRHYNF
ncbi:prohormone-2-like isoform X2 [Adelges cooleyi]|uniref:prohormone-2-like isoform X2 n=1 Tax=Adelges cooleyi TaxID=133065 RepID=UPI00217FB0DA|nr:prohormone-2-like isoform X2 [Adelges cooleyi]